MVAEMDRQNVIANNLANVNTVGFKKDNVTTIPFEELFLNAYNKRGVRPVGRLGLGVEAVTQYVNFTNGPLQTTGNPNDLAIEGTGLFAIETPNGVRYQRAGNFVIDKDHYLVTQEGFRVLGENGPIQFGAGDFNISETGEITQADGVINRLQIFGADGMSKEGQYFYTNQAAESTTNFRIIQGALEHSNINTVYEMVQMITATRNYETNQKALMAHDETLGRAVNELAK
jgi:flagellar basal-body rod protein FlgG